MPAQGWGSGLRKQLIARYPFSLSKSGFDILHTKKWIADKLFLTVCWAFPAVKLKKKKEKKLILLPPLHAVKVLFFRVTGGKERFVCLFEVQEWPMNDDIPSLLNNAYKEHCRLIFAAFLISILHIYLILTHLGEKREEFKDQGLFMHNYHGTQAVVCGLL